jgi:hypothetical protein
MSLEGNITPVESNVKAKQDDGDAEESIRTFFPETWLWDIIKIGFVKVCVATINFTLF